MNTSDPSTVMWAEACALIERAERLHRQFFQPAKAQAVWAPPVDVFESEQEVLVVAVLPGVARDDLQVYLEGGELIVEGIRRLPPFGAGTVIRRLEVPYGRFERRIQLAAGTSFRLHRLELANGCLSLRLLK